MDNLLETRHIDDWVVRVREPDGEGPHPVILLLHGWTGNEESMWIFASRLPDEALLLAPRGIYEEPIGGYRWAENQRDRWSDVESFHQSVQALLELLTPQHFPNGVFNQLSVVGFSQGAALGYTLTLLHPEKFRLCAGLAGFLPAGIDELVERKPLQGKHIFVTHGSRDDMVPVARAREAVAKLEQAGAKVAYCEDDVGHKLSLTCFKGLEAFFEKHFHS